METNQSNISRDHIAMEAMKVIMSATIVSKRTPWARVRQFFNTTNEGTVVNRIPPEDIARWAYDYADAMIEEREKRNENQ